MTTGPPCARPAHSVSPAATVQAAMSLMKGLPEGCLVVVDENNFPLGILTGRDVALRVVGAGLRASAVRVDAVMTQPVFTIPYRASLEEVTRSLKSCGVRRLPMVGDDGKLEGIVTAGDLFAVLWGDLSQFGAGLLADP